MKKFRKPFTKAEIPSKSDRSNRFWWNFRETTALLLGLGFWAMMLWVAMNLGKICNGMDDITRVGVLIVFAGAMYIATFFSWRFVLGEWLRNDYFLPFLPAAAMFIFFIGGVAIFTVFMTEALGFYWEYTSDVMRLLPVVVGFVAISWNAFDILH